MWPDRLSSPGPLALESDTLLTVLCGHLNETVLMMGHNVCLMRGHNICFI